jgi:integrase
MGGIYSGKQMAIYWDHRKHRWRWDFKAVVDGRRVRITKLLPAGTSEAQARRYDAEQTPKEFLRLSSNGGRRSAALIERAVHLYLNERCSALRDSLNSARNLAWLQPYFAGKALDRLGEVSRAYVRDQEGLLAPATVRQRLATLRAAVNYALKYHGLGSRDFVERMVLPSVRNAREYFLTRAEVLQLARACTERSTRAWVLMCFATGARPGELMRAERHGDFLVLPKSKNGDRQVLPIHPRVRRYLRHWPMGKDYSWHSCRFREAREKVGLDYIHPHDLRHSTASALVASGVTLVRVGNVLGHRSLQATSRYAHLVLEDRARALEALWTKPAAPRSIRLLANFSTTPSKKGERSVASRWFIGGPPWSRTRHQRIMSPLL